MNKETFLEELRASLVDLSDREREDAIAYYDEWIDDRMQDRGCTQEEAVEHLGPTAAIVSGILEARESAEKKPPVRAEASEGFKTLSVGADEVRRVLIRTKNTRLAIKPAAGNDVTLRYSEGEYHSYDCTLENGLLTLELRPQARLVIFGIHLLSSSDHIIELNVPGDFAAAIDAQTGNASVTMENVSLWGTLKLRTSNARAEATGLSAKEIDIRSSNGKLFAGRLRSGGSMNLRTGNGRIEATNLVSKGQMTLETTNARVEAEQLLSDESIRIQSSNGPLHVSKLYADSLSLITSNGSISGSLPGRAEEYTVHGGTSNAKNSLKNHPFSGSRQLEARTSNGGIKLAFEG